MKAYIDPQKCPADHRICKPLEECPEQAISWVEDDDVPLGERMMVDEDKCTGCGECIPLCCGFCIELR